MNEILEMLLQRHKKEDMYYTNKLRELVEYINNMKIALDLINLNLIASIWNIGTSATVALLNDIYEHLYSFHNNFFISYVEEDYRKWKLKDKFGRQVFIVTRGFQYDWSKFDRYNQRVEMFITNPTFDVEFVQIASQKDRLRLYFEHRADERALYRLSLGMLPDEELEITRAVFETVSLFIPNPFK